MKQLTDQEAQVTIGLLLSVPYAQVGSNGLKNAAAIVQKLEQVEETNVETTKSKSSTKSKSA